jgi:hypothetical protein
MTVGPNLTAAAAVTPERPAPTLTATARGITPPLAMHWVVANKLPATTFSIPACIPVVITPDREFQSAYRKDFGFYVSGGSMRGPGPDLPATGPAAPKPSMLRHAGAKIGVKTAPTAAPPTRAVRESTTQGDKA